MLLGRLAQGAASAFWQTPRYRSCSRYLPHLARYQHRAPTAVLPQHPLDGAGTSLFRWGVVVVCDRYTNYDGHAPRTAGRQRRNIVPNILADTETFRRKYHDAASFCSFHRKLPSPLTAHQAHGVGALTTSGGWFSCSSHAL